MKKWAQIRGWLFLAAVCCALLSIGFMIGLRISSEHWDGLYGHVNELGDWVGRGLLAALVSFTFSWFGRGWKRIALLVVAAICIAIWLRESYAV